MLDMRGPLIVANMVHIAEGDGREAVQARRSLGQEKERIQEQRDGQEEEGPSEAAVFLRKFKEKNARRLTAHRTKVVEEVEVTPREAPAIGA